MEKLTHTQLISATITVLFLAVYAFPEKPIYSSKLIHRFSNEAHSLGLWAGKNINNVSTKTMSSLPDKKSFGQMRMLLGSDLKRQRLKLGTQNKLLVSSQGTQTVDYGNELGWLHYIWIDIGTPKTSFLVALDTGSDMSWVPCQCKQCAPLSLSNYGVLDRELGEYNPPQSNTSKVIPCSHELCKMGSNCENPKGNCPYTVNYLSEYTASSGFLFEDKLHLASFEGNKLQSTVLASVIIGCGSKQSGNYLEGIAPDGVLGLGPGDISIPSLLAKSGLISRSFSFCYDKSYTGTLFFGDEGPTSQKSTSFLPLKENNAYIVEVESYCIGGYCLKQTGYKAQVDTGSSFTYLPSESYEKVVSEFDRQANSTRIVTQDFECCFQSRLLKVPNFPSLKLVFSENQSFVVEHPWFHIVDDQGDLHCLGIHRMEGDIGIIGQNFLMGYRMVFDWERRKLGWSSSNCQDIGAENITAPSSNAPPNPLPANEQRNPHGHATAPAVAGRTPPKSSVATSLVFPAPYQYVIAHMLLLVCNAHITYLI